MATASFRWILQLHVSTKSGSILSGRSRLLRQASSGPLKLALMQSPSDHIAEKGNSSILAFMVTDINTTVTKLIALGAELDGTVKNGIQGKVATIRCPDGYMLDLYEAA